MTQPDSLPPLQIEVTRGDLVESVHLASGAVVDAQGGLVHAWGGIAAPVFSRSAIKPLQALPIVETGAAERFAFSDRELSLACASHGGEPVHVETVMALLERLGLGPENLECGSHLPLHEPSAHALIAAGEPAIAVHNNCSGKHTGMLAHVMHKGESPAGYIRPDHPAQQRVQAVLEDMTGLDLSRAPRGTDGCGFPQFGMPLRSLALAMARMADPSSLSPERREAIRRIFRAMAAEPFMVAGSGRFCSAVIAQTEGRVIAKTGAEGVYMAALPGQGLGIALKVHDGAPRAGSVALGAILRLLGALGDKDWAKLRDYVQPTLLNRAGMKVGKIRCGDAGLHPPGG